ERVELFDTSEHESADPQNDGREAFDEVLGLLAQLGSGPIPKVLWHRVVHELLEGPVALRANFIIKHSGRFGILDDTPDELTFAKPHFVEALSKSFDEQDDAAELHAKLAKILLDHHKEPTDEQVRRILSHALAGQEIELAIKLLSDAGEAAYRRLELDAAREHYIQLRSLIEEGPSGARNAADESPDRFARMWLRLGEIHGALGEHGAAQDALQRVLEQTDDSAYRLRGAASKLLADLAMWQNRFEFALEHYELAQEYFRKAALPRPFVATIAEMGRCALLLGRLRKAEALLTQGLDKARALDDVNLMARMHRYLGQTLSRLGDFGEANDHLEQAALLFEKLERPMDLVATLDDLGKNHLAGGRYGVSRDIYVKLAGLVSESGLSPSRSPLVGQAKALAAMSDFEQAEFHLVEALSHFSGRGEAVEAAEVQFCLGDLYLATKRPKLAGEHYAHVWERAQAVGHARLAFDAAMRQAYAAFDEGDAEKAYDFLTSGAEYATGLGQDDAVQLARTHIIYLQLLEHGFRTGADAFSSLQSAENPGRTQRSQLVREIFRADMAIARKDWTEASKRLDNAHTLAAFCSEYGLFLHINRRKALVSKKLDQSFEGPTHDGAALGSLLPPEVGARRPRHS
ncbi:MAG: tetratricopeptide repeat protein, partial [Bradymonadaceae bacterium]